MPDMTNLPELLAQRGYRFRQHLDEKVWTDRALTVVDLSPEQQQALKTGGLDGLEKAVVQEGRFLFPATDIRQPQKIRASLDLSRTRIASPEKYLPLARQVARIIKAKCGMELKLLDDSGSLSGLLADSDLILIGGSHDSRLACDLALRYQTGFIDGAVPGAGGWAVATHVGLEAHGNLVLQIAADESATDAVTEWLSERIQSGSGKACIPFQHTIVPGPDLAAILKSWPDCVASFAASLPMPVERSLPTPDDIEALADYLAVGLDSGGPDINWYNQFPLKIAVECARYYQVSADDRALKLFHALLLRFADYYLGSPQGASYPSDLDFILGHMILYYSRLEHHPVFSPEDRLLLGNLLLACSRSVLEYARTYWPPNKKRGLLVSGKPGLKNRHNHQTFPARSLLFAHDYFARYGIADAEAFRAYADEVFSGDMWQRGKQTENAASYEILVYDHGAVYSAFTGRGLSLFSPGALEAAASRVMITTDNFFRMVDCGDTGVSMQRGSDDTLAVLAGSCLQNRAQAWFAHQSLCHSGNLARFNKSPGQGTTGLHTADIGDPPATGCWEFLPLDDQFIEDYIGARPSKGEYFDKMAMRSGWTDDAQYILLEGVGCRSISHSHVDPNSIARMNHLGRHWLVSNGYGRRAGINNVRDSFSSRIRGPEDHNMLVLQRSGATVEDTPPACIQVCRSQDGPLLHSLCMLPGYGGVDWARTLVVVNGVALLVIDCVDIRDTGLDQAVVEWNALGKYIKTAYGARLEQDGVYLHIHTSSDWTLRQEANDRSADWQKNLDSGDYPHASFPLCKLLLQAPACTAGSRLVLATLFGASRHEESELKLNQDIGSGKMTVSGLPDWVAAVSGRGFDLQLSQGVLTVNINHS